MPGNAIFVSNLETICERWSTISVCGRMCSLFHKNWCTLACTSFYDFEIDVKCVNRRSGDLAFVDALVFWLDVVNTQLVFVCIGPVDNFVSFITVVFQPPDRQNKQIFVSNPGHLKRNENVSRMPGKHVERILLKSAVKKGP